MGSRDLRSAQLGGRAVKLSRHDARSMTELRDELDTIRLSDEGSLDLILAQARALLEVEVLAVYAVRSYSPELERFHESGGSRQMQRLLARAVGASASRPVFFYDLIRPAPDQRNRIIEATAWVDRDVPGTWLASGMCRDLMRPLGLAHHKQVRALLCEGAALLAWFGAVHPEPLDDRQLRLLTAMVEPMRRRLSAERRLQGTPRSLAALEVALEHLGSPAFVVGPRGEIHETNAAGRALLDERKAEIKQGVRDAITGRPSEVELFTLHARGVPGSALAMVRPRSIEARLAACVARCVTRWQLTPRQGEVLGLVSRGLANATIAAALGCGDRAVELHLTALFDRAGVESRAALVARVLTQDSINS